jgi:hypothetical protein
VLKVTLVIGRTSYSVDCIATQAKRTHLSGGFVDEGILRAVGDEAESITMEMFTGIAVTKRFTSLCGVNNEVLSASRRSTDIGIPSGG